MTKYRKKPVIIDAEQYRPGLEDGFEEIYRLPDMGAIELVKVPYIDTLEGKHYITEGDMIITGVKGERYPCKADIFEMTYEKVEDA